MDVTTIQRQAALFRLETNRTPTLDDLTSRDSKGRSYIEDIRLDPWHNAYVILVAEDGTLEVRSLGPDGAGGTEDDVSSRPPGKQ
jgi:hypothetical protein